MRRSDTADSAMSLVSDDGDAGNKVDHPKEEGAHEGIHGIAAEDDDEDYEGDDISNDRMHSLHSEFLDLVDRERVDGLKSRLLVEVRLKPESNVIHSRIKMLMSRYIHEYHTSFVVQEELPDEWKEIEMFEEHVERVWISECSECQIYSIIPPLYTLILSNILLSSFRLSWKSRSSITLRASDPHLPTFRFTNLPFLRRWSRP